MTNDKTPYPRYRNLSKPDGTKAKSWNGKLHCWDGPALITPEGKKEYYIYGLQYTQDAWKEAKSNRNGTPFYKDPSFKDVVRF